jgi:redox-sensitive bicupin YhaK (pirin superfamily)
VECLLWIWIAVVGAKDKMIPPNYQELKAKDIPVAKKDGVEVKVIAGKCVYTRTPTMYLDVVMQKNSVFDQEIPDGFRGFVYILEGSGIFGETKKAGNAHQMMLFDGKRVQICYWGRVAAHEAHHCPIIFMKV